jgi:hypothetical protein
MFVSQLHYFWKDEFGVIENEIVNAVELAYFLLFFA